MADPEAPDPELYILPGIDDLEYWDRFMAAGLHQPAPEPVLNGKGWQWVNLADPEYAIPPDPPAIHGLLYAGKRHVLSGPQESAKTLIAYWLLLQALEQGHGVAILDFEMGPVATRRMLTDLGATEPLLPLITYTEPPGPPTDADLERMVNAKTAYALIDASAGAFDTSGLDDNSRKDAEQFARQWVQPLFREGISTIILDHVTKNAETRGKYAIGSERKTGGADVHLGFEALKTLTRGGTGVVKVTVHKDRPAYLQRPTVALIELASDTDTHQVTVTVKPPVTGQTEEGFRHTIYMERVSRTLETSGEPMSQRQVEDNTDGGRDYILKGLQELVSDGFATLTTGARNANIYTLITPYRKPENDLPTTSPPPPHGEVISPPPHLPTALHSAGERGEVSDDTPNTPTSPEPGSSEIDVYDPTIQHLLDDDIPW